MAIEQEPNGHDVSTGVVSDQYRIYPQSWPDRPLTYSFVESGSPPVETFVLTTDDFVATAPIDVRGLFREAVSAWENVCGVDLAEVGDDADADIRVGWMAASDGRGQTLGVARRSYADVIYKVQIGFDPADYRAESNAVGFYDTALHEIGHAIGIAHSDVENTVMAGLPDTEYWHPPGRNRLTADDIAAARAVWGPPTQPPVPNPPPDTPTGGAGDDTIVGGGGNDTIDGGAGDDALLGGDGNDYINGGAGNDRLWGQAGNDSIDGGTGDDRIFGEGGNDTIAGGDGEDRILSGIGDDSIDGGAGFDRVWGGDGADTIHGGAGSARNFLAGEGGNDSIVGGAGVDIVIAGAGNDSVNGGAGADRIIGGDGDDTIEGGDGRNYLNGSEGDDSITGGADRDYLDGEGGNDTLNGGASRDVLAGGAGNDSLVGGAEGDTFFGQEGADTFVIEGGRNWIMDFDDADRLAIGMNLSQVQGAATQLGTDLHIALAGGGDLYLANTTLAEIEADNLIV